MTDLAPVIKPPAFQFYARDWLSSTLGMPWDVAGVYIHLLAWSWDNGPLPDNPRWRRRLIGEDSRRLWKAQVKRWKKTPRGYVNLRLELQRRIQSSYHARAAKAASARWNGHHSESSIAQADAKPMLRRGRQASFEHVLNRSPASASASAVQDQDQPAASRPVIAPPFKIYSAIARRAIVDEPTNDLGEIAERFKRQCAKQGLPYDAAITTKAINAARAALAKRA